MPDDPDQAKETLRQSVASIQAVFRDRSIKAQIREIEAVLSGNPEKISYQKRVLKVLRRDATRRSGPTWWSGLMRSLGRASS